ncbi:hypothetical protein [Arthrobacter sp. H14]|uniref:hypothetical protein n=1 Tax=Arthrobacter sp. H14 TaxID=1312959 RepID=UPI00047A46BE|nr:hypothetical protein [Arthrobacter sp. H14]
MTATTAPKELLAMYRQDARQNALDNGVPANRSSFPGLGCEATGMIYLRGKQLTYQPMHSVPSILEPEKIAELLTGDGTCTVVADAKTFARMLVMADNMPSNDFKSLGRRLRISRGLPVSMKLPILTEALSSRYWLQDGLAENSIADWAEAFDVAGPSTAITMRSLITLASDGQRPTALKHGRSVDGMADLEKRIMEQCAWSGISTDCYVYSMLEQYSAKAIGLRTIDPGLLEMHMIDGQVCKIVPMNVAHKTFTASVSSPFKLKEGRKVRLTDGEQIAEVYLNSLRFGEGSLHAVFEQPGSRGPGALMISRAKKGTAPLFAADAVFESFGTGLKNKRWMGDAVQRVTGRDVPLDVALAGAPVD